MIKWKSQYNTKIVKIDNQHKKLIDILNEIDGLSLGTINNSDLFEIGVELINYSKYHFSTEEKIMKKYDYYGYEYHKEQHLQFVKEIKNIIDRSNGIGMMLLSALNNFLKEWIIDHLLGVDQELSEFLISIGADEIEEEE